MTTSNIKFSSPTTSVGCQSKSQCHSATVIWLHGLGDTGQGWLDAMQAMTSAFGHIKFVLPTAPLMAITFQGGMPCTAWHDIENLADLTNNKFAFKRESAQLIRGLIEAELSCGIDSSRIVLGGFSQGAAMSLFTGLLYEKPLAGLISLSGYLCDPNIPKQIATCNKKVPILMCHASQDMIVQTQYGRLSHALLNSAGCNVEWKEYDIPMHMNMGHNVVPQELKRVAQFIARVLPEQYQKQASKPSKASNSNSAQQQEQEQESKRNDINVCGGLKPAQVDQQVHNACAAIQQLCQALTPSKFTCFKPIACGKQVVAGINLFVKIQVDQQKFIHARVWCKLDRTYQLSAIQFGKTLRDDITYFDVQDQLVQ